MINLFSLRFGSINRVYPVPYFEKEVLYETETLSEDCPLLVKMTFFGTIPSYGIAYTDKDGKEKQFSVEMSGVDGSLFLGDL